MIDDLHMMAADGLVSPFSASDSLYSPVSARQVMTFRSFPGLSSMVPTVYGPTPCVFVEKLPEINRLQGFLQLTQRGGVDGEPQECWLALIEAHGFAWQFMTVDENFPTPSSYAVLLEWKPKSLGEALKMHDEMIAQMGDSSQMWIIGSDLEKEAVSRFVLSSGSSSLAHPFSACGAVDNAIENIGQPISMKEGPCLRLKAYEIDWFGYADA